jgi:hypothetical protein
MMAMRASRLSTAYVLWQQAEKDEPTLLDSLPQDCRLEQEERVPEPGPVGCPAWLDLPGHLPGTCCCFCWY